LTETQGERWMTEPSSSLRGPGDALDRIVATKRDELESLRPRAPELRSRAADAPPTRPFQAALADPSRVSLIAEVKRRSPGAGAIDPTLDPVTLARRYEDGGAAAISVLTDGPWFGGALADLVAVRGAVQVPCLRKDFTLDPLHLHEARAHGADAILLIVRILSDSALREFREEAESLGLGVLVEAHDAEEVSRALDSGARILGVNNRDLQTFQTSLDVTFGLLPGVPNDVVFVSESGIRTPADVEALAQVGVDAILVGEALVRAGGDATEAAASLSGFRPIPRARP